MTVYTLELRELVETVGTAWMENYPIFEESHRAKLNQDILDTYWNREIAHESHPMFLMAFRRHMSLNMPRFNALYRSERLAFDPFITTKMETITEAEGLSENRSDGKTSSTTDANASSESVTGSETEGLNVGYAFPQTRLDNRKDYATSAGDSESSVSGHANGTETGHTENVGEDSRESVGSTRDKGKSITQGYQGIPSNLLMAFRETIISVDLEVINSLEPLFMGIWGTNTRRTGAYYA